MAIEGDEDESAGNPNLEFAAAMDSGMVQGEGSGSEHAPFSAGHDTTRDFQSPQGVRGNVPPNLGANFGPWGVDSAPPDGLGPWQVRPTAMGCGWRMHVFVLKLISNHFPPSDAFSGSVKPFV
ncbi:hypothetical protein KSP39_PZI014464 [Platanthera zijinensis]|uniref:Uncharacterized protein n=1 Tax=Platanthera zijinensis TaxID=2320716 RepID=A0AAP0BBQ9_9ASPA